MGGVDTARVHAAAAALLRARLARRGRRRFVAARLAETVEWQMAVVLIQERQEALVVARRHPEQLDELAIVPLRPLQTRLDDLTQVGLSQLAIDERGNDDGPEALAPDHH